MRAPTRVLHVFGRMNRGGAEMRTLDVMRNLDRDRFLLDYCSLSGQAGDLDDDIRALGGIVHFVALGPRFPWRFCGIVRRGRYGVVHSHIHYASGLVLLLAWLMHVPVRIAHFRTTHDGRPITFVRRAQSSLMKYLIDACSTHILAVSKGALEASWPGYRRDARCRVVYNGLDAHQFEDPIDREGVRRELGVPSASTLIVHVGRMDHEKNHSRVLSIFRELNLMRPDTSLLFVGRGGNDIERSLRERTQELGLSGKVVFAGLRSDVPRILKASDLMLFPSVREGLPGVVLEACAAGIHVVASDLPGTVEIAEAFANVHVLGLNQQDSDWCAAIQACLAGSPPPSTQFDRSPFSIENAKREIGSIWESGSI